MTGHWHFGLLAEAYGGYPFASAGHASLAAGVHDGYSFDSSGNGMRVATLTLASVTALSYSERNVPGGGRKRGNGIWLRIAEGALNGLWVRESGRAWPIGFVDQIDFLHARPIRLAAGTYTGRSHDSSRLVERIGAGIKPWSHLDLHAGRPDQRAAVGLRGERPAGRMVAGARRPDDA